MSFIDKYCAIFNNSVKQHSVTISRAEFANLLGIFSKQEQQLDQLKCVIKKYEECNKYLVEENGKTYTRLEYKLLRTLTEIKELLLKTPTDSQRHCVNAKSVILQKISESEVENE